MLHTIKGMNAPPYPTVYMDPTSAGEYSSKRFLPRNNTYRLSWWSWCNPDAQGRRCTFHISHSHSLLILNRRVVSYSVSLITPLHRKRDQHVFIYRTVLPRVKSAFVRRESGEMKTSVSERNWNERYDVCIPTEVEPVSPPLLPILTVVARG